MIARILIAIGVIVLTGVILYYIASYLQQERQDEDSEPTPDDGYMQQSGGVCPSGWVYRGKRGTKNICQNYYDIPVPESCYDNIEKKQKLFRSIKNWKDCEESHCRGLKERCTWIKRCGLKPHMSNQDNQCPSSPDSGVPNPYYSWIGVTNRC